MMRTIVITDVHGMAEELADLLQVLQITDQDDCICLGDITDKGPDPVRAARLLMAAGFELTASNHDDAYVKFLKKGKTPEQVLAGKSKYKERRAKDYAELLKAPDVCEYLLSKKAYIQRTIAGRLITFVHAGVTPGHDIYNMNGKAYNEIIRVRYLDNLNHEMVAMKNIGSVYPDEKPNWVPSKSNVIEWQERYDGRYGTIIHGHNIVEYPTLWQDQQNMPGTSFTKNSMHHKVSRISDWDVVSLDTGAFKAGKLTAIVINEGGSFYFEQVNCETEYM